jgi:GYF domain 2
MGFQWFYGRGSDISGPVSDGELVELAASGKVLPSDTVWRQGREAGVSAAKVRYLFAAPVPIAPASVATVPESNVQTVGLTTALPEPDDVNLVATPAADEPVSAESAIIPPPVPPPAPARSARAIAGKGTVIVGQDGKTVKFRMKCTICGKEDSSWKSLPIPRGIARSSFFCPKCRKRQDCELQGVHWAPSNLRRLLMRPVWEGDCVRHADDQFVGLHVGYTRLSALMELEGDLRGVRVQLPDGTIRIASERRLETVERVEYERYATSIGVSAKASRSSRIPGRV